MRPRKPPRPDRTLASYAPEVANRARPRNSLPAAVLTDQDAPVARVVPPGAKLRKVGEAVLGYDSKPANLQGHWTRNTQRLAEVEILIAYRAKMTAEHGQVFETTAEDYLAAILPELLLEGNLPRRPAHRANAITWATEMLPELLDRRGLEWFDGLEGVFERAGRRPKALRADAVAKLLNVTWDERKACRLKTIGAVDMNQRQRRAERRKVHAERERARREREGATPRGKSLARTKPWEAEGIKRSAWYARKQAGRTISCATSDQVDRTNSCASDEASRTISCAVICKHRQSTDSSTSASDGYSLRRSDEHVGRPPGEGNALQPFGPLGWSAPVDLLAAVVVGTTLAALDGYTSGPMPKDVRKAVKDGIKRAGLTQHAVAARLGLRQPHIASVLRGHDPASAVMVAGFCSSAGDA